jgi:hypothetical protein
VGTIYTSGQFKQEDWDHLKTYITKLQLDKDVKKELLEKFLSYKGPNLSSSSLCSLLSYSTSWIYSLITIVEQDGEDLWKGEKYLKILKTMQEWVKKNETWLSEKLQEGQDNPSGLKSKVEEIIKFLREMKLIKPTPEATIEKRKVFNETQRANYKEFLKKTRDALSMRECQHAFVRYTSIGEHATSGCALILMNLCQEWFTGVNMIPFVVKLMKKMIIIGLRELAKTEKRYELYYNSELYPNPLDIEPEVIHKAIENVPSEHTTPPLSRFGTKVLNYTNFSWDPHMLGIPRMNIIQMVFKGLDKPVTLLRLPTPTAKGDSDINPEFSAFLLGQQKRVLLFSLQSNVEKPESIRTQSIFSLNSNNTFVIVLPVIHSALFNQENEYADTRQDQSRFNTKLSFLDSIRKTIIPDPTENNTNPSNNYLIPPCWLSSDKYKKIIQDCLNNTYDILFGDAQELTALQRRVLVKVFGVFLAFEMIKYARAEYFAFLCNHSADRTGVFVTILLKILLISFDREQSPVDSNKPNFCNWNQLVEALIEGVPMVVAKREMNEFHSGLMEVLEVLKDKSIRKRLTDNLGNIFGITDFKFSFAKESHSKSDELKPSKEVESGYTSFDDV